jgi:hypothetical protein
MSLYNTNTLTAQTYESVNPTNSNPAPFTATGGDSNAGYRGPHAAPTQNNVMKGGYRYKNYTRKSKRTKGMNKSISSVLGMDVSYRGRNGGSKKRRSKSFSSRNRTVGMTLARGLSGGRRHRHRRRSCRTMKRRTGGMSAFPTSYSTPANIGGISAMAMPAPYGLNYS